MTEMWGADPEQLDALARAMGGASEALRSAAAQLHTSYHQSPWRGPDADRHRAIWDTSLHRNLLSVSSELGEWRNQVAFQAAQQRSASAASGSLAAGGVPFGGAQGHGPADINSIQSGPAQANGNTYVTENGMLIHREDSHVSDGQSVHTLTHDGAGGSEESTAFTGWQMNDGTDRSIGADGARVAAHADASFGMQTSQEHSQALAGGLTGKYGSSGFIGAGVNSDASATVGLRGVAASVGFNAEAAVKDGVTIGISNKLFSVGAGGSVYGGMAATGLVSGSVTADNVGLSCKLGAALGVGAALDLNVSVNPSAILKEFSQWPW